MTTAESNVVLTRPARVLVLASTFPLSETDTQPQFIRLLCKELVARDFDVTVLVPAAPGSPARQVVDGLTVLRYRYFFRRFETLAYGAGILENIRASKFKLCLIPFFILGQLIAVMRLLVKGDWDVIHAHWIIPQGLVAVFARVLLRNKTPLCVTSHGGDLFAIRGGVGTFLKRWVLSRANAVTVVSTAMVRYIQEELNAVPNHIDVMSMGVDLARTFSCDNSAKREPCQLIFVGRLAEKKGVSCLLRAIPILMAEHPQVKLCIVGDGVLRESLQHEAESLGIADQVEFKGAVENHKIPQLLNQAAVAVVPSVVGADGDQEGLGLVAVEAMGCGCAVVASSLPALRDVIEHGETGLLANPGDPADLADKLGELLGDPDRCARLAHKGREFVLSRFDWQVVGERYSRLLNEVAAGTAGRK